MKNDLSNIAWTEEKNIKEIIQELDEIKCLDLIGKNTYHIEDTFSFRNYKLHNETFSCGFVFRQNTTSSYWYKETHGFTEEISLEDLLEQISEAASNELLFHLDLFRG